ncbi:MAG TPA: LPS export ABC transporter periplasmic protein LptC [Candidatus Obscuribacterales bacterium]
MNRRYWWLIGLGVLFFAIAVGVRTCRQPDIVSEDTNSQNEDGIPGLTLRDVTLEQQNEQGQLIWKVDAEAATYSPDQKEANLVNPQGEFYQDGALLYRVKADRGIIQNDGQVVLLEGNIVATGVQNQMVLRGQTLEWTPEQDLLVVRNGLTGTHPQVQAQANEARVYDREKRMELIGQVVATTVVANPQVEPWLKLQGEILQWQWEQETLTSNQTTRVERFENAQVTEVLVGQNSLVELAANRVTLTEAVTAQLLEVPLTMTSRRAVWEVETQIIRAAEAVRVVNGAQQITVTSQNGEFNLATQMAYFTQDVLAIAAKNNGRLTTDRLSWNLEDQTVLAEGAVNYQQSDPQLKIQGPRARGRIEQQTVVVDGGQVVTEIVPNFN